MEFLHMPNELSGLSDRVLSHWFPTRKSSHESMGKEHGKDQTLKEACEVRGPAEWRCDLARGSLYDYLTNTIFFTVIMNKLFIEL